MFAAGVLQRGAEVGRAGVFFIGIANEGEWMPDQIRRGGFEVKGESGGMRKVFWSDCTAFDKW